MEGKMAVTIRFVFGLVLLVAAVAVAYAPGNSQLAEAAPTVTNYSSVWRADQLYAIRYTRSNGTVVEGPSIGVSRWNVNGTFGTTTYTETWTGPAVSTAPTGACNNNNYDATKWLIGCVNRVPGNTLDPFGTSLRLFTKAVGTIVPFGNSGGPGCRGAVWYPSSPNGCITTDGTYSATWTGNNTTVGQVLFQVSYIPLEWTVNGSLTVQ